MNVFDMIAQIAPVIANLSTEGASVGSGTCLRVFDYVLIELLVSCKQEK
jgi:hypothetical protein